MDKHRVLLGDRPEVGFLPEVEPFIAPFRVKGYEKKLRDGDKTVGRLYQDKIVCQKQDRDFENSA